MTNARANPTRFRSFADRLSWLPAIGIASVPVIVVPAILWARVTFHVLHPDADPKVYLTISRAISDPAIGEPFAFWITIAAAILWLSVQVILWMFVAEHPRPPAIGVTRDRIARGLWPVMWVAMTAACVGMVMLSHHRFGSTTGENRLHMIGSYVFFAGQAATILFAAIYHSLVAPARAAGDTAFFPARWRARAGYVVVAAAALYGVFFRIKSMDFGPATRWIVSVYVELETVLILVFLTYLAAFFVDVSRFSRSRGVARETAAVSGEAVPNPTS
ncbi:hypothetical protein [Pinisolibacter sp.]|uniref:hypothetical protein n=1 Tax=Pinisolibacter sp. TaxID=2172024 RepID=UPI002FDEFF23